MKDILEGINKVIAGPQKRSRVITEKDKRITAYHEAGHALVGRLLKNCDAVQEVSIIPRGMAAGYTISRPKTDDSHTTYSHLVDTIAMTMGGRAAEALIIKDITTGASMDIKQATSIARSMVTEWGMSPALSNVYYGGEQEVFIGRDYQTQASYSDEIAALIDSEIRKIVDTAYDRAYKILSEYRRENARGSDRIYQRKESQARRGSESARRSVASRARARKFLRNNRERARSGSNGRNGKSGRTRG